MINTPEQEMTLRFTALKTAMQLVDIYATTQTLPVGTPLLDVLREAYEAAHELLTEGHKVTERPSAAPEPAVLVPVVPIKKSVTSDYLICLDDGLKFKSLKRHLRKLGMSPDAYRDKWGLPRDYPMVAPNYSATRSRVARESGLGRKR